MAIFERVRGKGVRDSPDAAILAIPTEKRSLREML